MPMAAISGTELNKLDFKNLYGILRLNLKGKVKVTKILISSPKISGEFLADFTQTTPIVLADTYGSQTDEVALDCAANGGVQLSEDIATAFNIVLPPTAGDDASLKVSISYDDNKLFEKTIPNKVVNKIVRSQITSMKDLTIVAAGPEAMPDYIDKDGVNHGPGVKLGNVIWAPVNCGYNDDYIYGRLFQYGRKDGQEYVHEKSTDPQLSIIDKTTKATPETANPYTIYHKWSAPKGTWGGSDIYNNPIRTENDPCPEGWRVPNDEEFKSLDFEGYNSTWSDGKNTIKNLHGKWFGANHATATVDDPKGCVFFPATGAATTISAWKGPTYDSRGYVGYYLSSYLGTAPYYFGVERNKAYVKYNYKTPSCFAVRCVKAK